MSFGPRIPNTANHIACGDWLVKKLNSYQIKTTEQIGEVTAFNMSKLPLRNISGTINPNADKRYFSAHIGILDPLLTEIV